MTGYLVAMLICLFGWYQWFSFTRRLDKEKAGRALAFHALDRLYEGQFMDSCCWERASMSAPCMASTSPEDLCIPCFARKVLQEGRSQGLVPARPY